VAERGKKVNMKTELKTKSVSLLLVTIMLCSIFTGAVTADTNKSAANTTLALGNPRSCIGCAGYEPWYYYAGGIVNTANGNLYLAEEKDISIKARGFDIEIIRSYNSHNSGKHGPFGFGWTFNYNIYLVKNDDGSVTFFDEDGSVYTFSPAGGNNYTAPPGKHSKLTKNPDGSFTLWFTDGSKYNFGSNGEINNITDKNDNHLNFEYSLLGRLTRISDDSGLYLNLNYNLRGRISSVSDTLGREIRYEYNVNDLTKVTDAMGNSLLYFYYDNHKIRSMVDEMDNTLLFSYGTVSGVDRVSEIKGTVYDRQTGLYSNSITFYSFEYDTINKLVDVIDSNGRTISVRYNEAGNPIKITDLLGNTISINWKNHTQIGITDKNGNTFLYEYDAYGNLIDSTDHMGYSRYYRWTTINTDDKYISLLSNITNKKGYTTEYEYDRQGNLILVTDAHGNATTRAYDAFGYVTLLTERGGTQTVYFHDSHGNLINAADSTGNGTKFSYDLAGRLLSITDANNHSIEYEYNSNNNLIKIIENDQIETEYDYDALGKLVSVNDANGMQTEYKRYKGKTEIIEPLNTRTTHYYDYNGNLITVTNARGYNTSLEHDALGRVTAAYDNHGNIERFSYDALGNLIRYTDMNDTITTYAYDSLSRLIHVKYPSSDNIFYNWTETGKIISQQNRDSKITYQYDALDRLVSVLFDYGAFNRTISYHYGADDNPIAMMDPEGNITRYEYDELNRLVRIVDPSAGDIAFEYDEGSRRTVITYPNNASISYSYDRTDRISNIVNLKSNGEVISNYSYTYDTLGNRLSVNESGDITSYSYDALCQLIQATYPNADVARYGYDKNGNRLTMVNRTTSISYTYDADDRLLSDGTADYSYDANGNLIRKTDGSDITTYVYGDENRLIKAVLPDGTDAAYRYFPNGFRMSKTVDSNTTYYFYDREDILMELDANGIKLARYTHGQGIDDPLAIVRDGVRGYYLRDALGSVTSIINTDEKLLAEYQYDAYGVIKKITENLENPYTFTGREYDVETGLYYYRARYYSPEIGRFTTRDPIPTLELSPYVYVENNPVNYIDPSGESFLIIAGFIAVVGYAVCLVYGAASAINTYQEAFEQAIQSGRRRGELLDRLAEGDITPERLEALNTLVQDNLQNAAGAAWALYTSIPGTLKTGTLPTSVAGVIAGAGGSLMTSILSDGYVPDIDVIEERLGELTDEQREQFDRLHQALEDGDRRAVVGAIIDIDRKNYHPDDNHDVSIFSYSHSKTCTSKTGTFNYKSEEIAILANGFYEEFSDLLTELGESTTFVDVYTPLEELNGYRILIIPSGGFSGISSLSSFKSKLENYVKDGGTLIVYSQNHGYEFEAVPGDLSGYGWTEDQACHHRSVAINTYHPMLSGQDSVTLDVVVDGYFTTYPEDATILLTRTKNGMPAMLMYEYGNGTGTVIATTIYTDWAYGHHQATVDGKTLLRDMISWAKERKDMPGYGSGDTIDIPINVTSYIDLTSEKVKFEVIADNEVIDTVEVTTSVPPYETKTVDFTYTAPSKFGILHIDYLLVNDSYGEVQQVHDAQKFEVSKYAENPDGFVYRGKELQIWATSSDDYVAKGSEVVFTVYVRKRGGHITTTSRILPYHRIQKIALRILTRWNTLPRSISGCLTILWIIMPFLCVDSAKKLLQSVREGYGLFPHPLILAWKRMRKNIP
jgi:RHS repeat-associated protein